MKSSSKVTSTTNMNKAVRCTVEARNGHPTTDTKPSKPGHFLRLCSLPPHAPSGPDANTTIKHAASKADSVRTTVPLSLPYQPRSPIQAKAPTKTPGHRLHLQNGPDACFDSNATHATRREGEDAKAASSPRLLRRSRFINPGHHFSSG